MFGSVRGSILGWHMSNHMCLIDTHLTKKFTSRRHTWISKSSDRPTFLQTSRLSSCLSMSCCKKKVWKTTGTAGCRTANPGLLQDGTQSSKHPDVLLIENKGLRHGLCTEGTKTGWDIDNDNEKTTLLLQKFGNDRATLTAALDVYEQQYGTQTKKYACQSRVMMVLLVLLMGPLTVVQRVQKALDGIKQADDLLGQEDMKKKDFDATNSTDCFWCMEDSDICIQTLQECSNIKTNATYRHTIFDTDESCYDTFEKDCCKEYLEKDIAKHLAKSARGKRIQNPSNEAAGVCVPDPGFPYFMVVVISMSWAGILFLLPVICCLSKKNKTLTDEYFAPFKEWKQKYGIVVLLQTYKGKVEYKNTEGKKVSNQQNLGLVFDMSEDTTTSVEQGLLPGDVVNPLELELAGGPLAFEKRKTLDQVGEAGSTGEELTPNLDRSSRLLDMKRKKNKHEVLNPANGATKQSSVAVAMTDLTGKQKV